MFKCMLIIFIWDCTAYSNAAVQCPQPDMPDNGHGSIRQMNNMSTGSVVSYQCDVGYILVGMESRTCESNGAWSGNSPVCALNIALYKPALQSSTLTDGDLHYANLSTDGNFEGSCSSTMDEKVSWWQVDLLETYYIYAVEILMPSNPGGKSSLQELHIVTSTNDDFSSKSKSISLCYKHEGTLEINRLHTFICAQESPGRYVRLFTRNASLNLCEVVVLTRSAVSEWQCGTVKDMTTWGAFGGRCFYGSLESMPWFSANTHCEMNSATLAFDVDAGCHQFLISQIKYRSMRHAQSYWLGLSNTGKQWRWINGKPVKTSFWADPAANDVASTNMAYAAAMVLSFQWSWMPSLQALWYFWICQSTPKFCSSPGTPYSGGIKVSTQMYTIGSTADYYCSPGFVAEGERTRTCLENGTWSGTIPKCSAVDCGRPDIFLGASVKYLNESTAFGSLVEYQCPPGQKIAGAQYRSCQAEGKWSEKMPRCEEMDCGHPGEIEKGKVFLIENSTKIGTIAEYTCDGGFGLMGAAVRHCSASGSWIPSQAPVCYDVNGLHVTPFPSVGENGYQSNLITGFIVAVVILLVVIVIVVFWMWKKKKLYDTFSMSTMYAANSQLTSTPTINSNSCSHDVLYAFPTAVQSQPKEPNYYSNSNYNESTFDHANDIGPGTVRVLRASDLYPFNTVHETTPNVNVNTQSSVFGNRPQLYIAVDRPATAEQLESVVKNINFTLSQCRRQQPNNRPAIPSVFHTIRKMPTNSTKKNVVDFVRKKLSEVTFVPPQQQRPTISAPIDIRAPQERSASPTPSELFSFDDDDDDDEHGEEFVEESNPRRNDSQYYFPSSYSNASTQQERTAHYDCVTQNEPSTSTSSPVYAISSTVVPIRCRTSGDGESSKIYDLPPDAASKMNDNLAKVLLKQYYSTDAQENVYEVPCSEPSSTDGVNDSIVQDKVVLGNGVEIVHTYC